MAWLQDRHYKKAPIREAIIQIQVQPEQGVEVAQLEALVANPSDYATRRPIFRNEVVGQFKDGKSTATAKQDRIGFRLIGAEGKHIAAFRPDGFSFSRLNPYENWTSLRSEARRIWEIYKVAIGPAKIVRVSLRYINQLDLPSNLRDFSDYIRTFPTISSDLPQQLSGFFMQVQIPQPDLQALLILNETLLPPTDPKVLSIVLDTDIVKIEDFASDEAAWTTLDALRIRKNLIFEGSITNNTRDLIS